MTLVEAPAWPVTVIAIEPSAAITRGRASEFRRLGLSVKKQTSGTAALLDLGRDPGSVLLVPSDLSDIPLSEYVELAVSLAHSAVIVGIVPGSDADLIAQALALGAHDAVALPVGAEGLARALTKLKRVPVDPGRVLRCGDLTVDLGRYRVHYGEREVCLAPKEFALLSYLAEIHPRIAPPAELLTIKSLDGIPNATALRTSIGRIRRRFRETIPGGAAVVGTARGFGYYIEG